jgi:hypothetical protein
MYFIKAIINELVTNLKATWKFPDKKWYHVHLDNAWPHISQDSADYIGKTNLLGSAILPFCQIWLRVTFLFLEL